MASQYRRGADFERKVANNLTLDGYHVVTSRGSHGHADLIALKPGQTLLVQCKLGGPGEVPPAEWNALRSIAGYVGGLAIVASRPKRGLVAYHLMTGLKSGVRGVRPPCVEWTPDELTGYPAYNMTPRTDPPPPDAAEQGRPAARADHGAYP